MSIELNFFLQRDEYYAALEFFRNRRPNASADKLVGALLILLGGALWLVTGKGALFAIFLIVGLAVALLSAPLRRVLFNQKWAREPLFSTEHTIAADEQGVFFRMGQIESNLPWNYYESFLESRDGFLLVYGDSFNFLPKRVFAGETAQQQFRELMAKKLT
ncbi:MAG: YcxB family protein [Acidobacteria bacterium]|nr:YcxB family protein [Acidobacteriota bacterium]MBI3423215.1 YcxB family protein [Acidobacteriota bacterium]